MSEAMSHFDTAMQARVRTVEAVVCVPTFRRPEMLERTLHSVAAQKTGVSFAMVIVDNDEGGCAGLAVAERVLRSGVLRGLAILEPQQGNVHAINRAFATALARYEHARYFLMIDDDEIAEPEWLDTMISAARENECDIVGGPVVPVFATGDRARRRHPVFWPAFSAAGRVPMIYGSGNCLITRDAFERLGALFDPRFNFLGGGDTEFFTRAKAASLRFFWAEDAVVREIVGAERVTPTWILKRGLRIGAINYRIDCLRVGEGAALVKVLVKNAGVAGLAACRSLRLLARGTPVLEAVHPLAIALGRWLASFGIYPEQYRAKAPGAR